MKKFKSFITEQAEQGKYKSYILAYAKKKGLKVTASSRGGVHVRFPMEGSLKDFNAWFKKLGIEVVETPMSISGTFDTYMLRQVKDVGSGFPVGMEMPWVNNVVGVGTKTDKIFNTKELSPDSLGIAGKTLKADQIISEVEKTLKQKYDEKVVSQLVGLMKLAKSKKETITFTNQLDFNSKDLATVSKDFGEVLSGIWSISNMGFTEAHYPAVSNEKLIDIYGVRIGIHYPISVKSGGGGKVTIQNIIDAINQRAKTRNADHSKEKSLRIFNIVNNNSAKPAMIMLHQEMETPAIKKLGDIIGINWKQITWDNLSKFLDRYSNDELRTILAPFHKVLNTKITEEIWKRNDKMRFVVSPLGESIWKILNSDKEIKKSLTNVARQVTLVQMNIDVKSKSMTFKHNRFRDAEFEFGWAGYAAGNKLGFKMHLKK